jgi:hypothetical protein
VKAHGMERYPPCCAASRPGSGQDEDSAARTAQVTRVSSTSKGVTLGTVRLDGSVTSWRSAILLEAAANHSPAYYGIRTVSTNGITRRKYVEYAGGARELYNLESDAYELANKYNATSPPTGLASRLKVLKSCGADAAVTCRVAENGP